MKIALIRKKFTPYGGAEKYVSNLINSLLQDNHEIHLFTNSWNSNNDPAITCHHVPIIKGASFLKVLSFAFFSKRLIKKQHFDLIHSFERTWYQDTYRAGDGCHKEWLRQKKQGGSFLSYLGTLFNPLHLAILMIEKNIFREGHYKTIIANSNRGKQEIIKHYHVPEKNIEVIYNGVDSNEFTPENRKKYRNSIRKSIGVTADELLVLFTGSGFRRKGLSALIEAVSLVKKKRNDFPIRLIVAGKGNPAPFRLLAKRLNINDHITFLGPVKDIKKMYAAADIFSLPSLYEPFSNACCEAMASALPVITSTISGVAELIESGKNGLLIEDSTDSLDLASCILLLIDEKKRTLMGQRARETLLKYTLERQNKKLVTLLEGVAKQKRTK